MSTSILIAGDYCPKDRVATLIGKHTIFKGIQQEIKQADISIVNLECPVADNSCSIIKKEGPHLCCTEEAVEELAYVGFNVATLANNHILDYGLRGLAKSVEACAKYKISTVGANIDSDQATKTLYIKKNNNIAIINCCEHEFSIIKDHKGGANPLNPLKQFYAIKSAKEKADLVIVIVHGGIETCQYPTIRMKETYRFFVDAGADVVVNHHQHCYSGYEIYNGKPIFYGLGNFCFDWVGNDTKTWYEGYMVNLIFDNNKLSFELLPYTQCLHEVGVSFMSKSEITDFEKCIDKLNKVILDDCKLQNHVSNFYKNTGFDYKVSLEPYSGRLMTGLFRRNLIPSFMTERKILKLIDYIGCESHHERILFYLNSKIHNNYE